MADRLEAMLELFLVTCGLRSGFWRLCWAVWRLCWDYVGQLGALLAASESHVGPFGGYVVTMLGSWGSAGCF